MAEFLMRQETCVTTIERLESRFEQKWSKSYLSSGCHFHFPSIVNQTGIVIYDVSSTSWQLGIHTPLFISSTLFSKYIMNGIQTPTKNIETLCHAFLYAVDCDTRDKCSLEFTVPGNGFPPYTARSYLEGLKNQNIFIEVISH